MIQDRVRAMAARRLLFLPHAIRQMNKPKRVSNKCLCGQSPRESGVTEAPEAAISVCYGDGGQRWSRGLQPGDAQNGLFGHPLSG